MNCPVASRALEPPAQTSTSAIPFIRRPKTFSVAVRLHELSDGREICHMGKADMSSLLSLFMGRSVESVYHATEVGLFPEVHG
jgi:hypothetical protein